MEPVVNEFRGQKAESYARTVIYEGFPFFFYDIAEPVLNDQEGAVSEALTSLILGKIGADELESRYGRLFPVDFVIRFREKIIKPITYSEALEYLMRTEELNELRVSLLSILREFFPQSENAEIMADIILDNSIGYGKIAPLLRDDGLEEIMVNGYERSVFVFHRRYGHCKTNIDYSNKKFLDDLLQKIAKSVGKKIDSDHPLLDARLPDGNRANSTFSFVTPFGSTLTIRKFTAVPLTIVDLISNNTMTSELAAFFWLMVEGIGVEPMNAIIIGGSGTGKTTTLNALSVFIRFSERVISIEDTLELQLGNRDNWVQMETRPKLKGQDGITMNDLLKNALRMRPDRIIVGEVRGPEAQTLFVAMDTGHKGILGTLHSNSAHEMMLRLKSEPMNVPEELVPLLNLIIVQYRVYAKGAGWQRRVVGVTEVTSMERQALISSIYEWDAKSDTISRTDTPMHLTEVLATKTLRTKKDVEKEMFIRKKILDWMVSNKIRSIQEVELVVQQYYYNPDSLLKKVLSENTQSPL